MFGMTSEGFPGIPGLPEFPEISSFKSLSLPSSSLDSLSIVIPRAKVINPKYYLKGKIGIIHFLIDILFNGSNEAKILFWDFIK